MNHLMADKDDLYTTIFAELKHMGIKVPKVKKFKSNILKQEKIVQPSKSKIFGVSLADQEWIADSDYVLPKFIVSSITYLQQYSDKVGLFRKAGSNVRQRELRSKLEKGVDICGSEPNDVASLLKQWLRELPEPLIPQYMHDLFIRCQQLENNDNRITAHLLACLLLPPNHLHTLKYLLCFLADFASHSEENMMGAQNLALCMAPNIFVSNDSADKSSTNLVHIHVSIIQLLIENATKIGSIPESVTFQYSIQEGRSCSEMDSSGDFLDTVSSKRKKQKNGHVQDLLSGIKKLVGQNSTSTANAKTPEKYWNSHTTAPRSASKREADTDVESLLPIKKQPKLSDQDNMLQNVTPKDKGILNFGTAARSAGHTRKKSFGLLRKKERKRQKSCHGNPLPVVTFNVIPPENQPKEADNCKNLVKAAEENAIPASDSKTCKLSKSESIKKSSSESYLTPSYGKKNRLSLPSPKSSDVKLEIPSYFLWPYITDKNVEHSEQQPESTQMVVDKKDVFYNTVVPPKNLEIPNIDDVAKLACEQKESVDEDLKDNKSSQNSKLLAKSETPQPEIQELKNGGACKRVSRKGSNVQRMSSRGISAALGTRASSSDLRSKCKNKSPQKKNKNSKTELRSISDSQIKQGSYKSARRRSPNFEKSSHKGGLSRNEAFIIKPKSHRQNSQEHLENKPNRNENTKASKKANARHGKSNINSLHKSQSLNSENGDRGKGSKSSTKRASRNGSLIRGRPNTVNTGLRCELRGNESIIATTESNEKRKSLRINKNEVVEANESCSSIGINKENERNKDLIIQASESRERKSIKLNKNEVAEANDPCNPIDMNKENKRGNEPVLVKTERHEKRKSRRLSKKANESCIPEEIGEKNRVLDQKDISLSMKFENFHLSSPVNSSETLIDFINSMFTLEDKPLSQEQPETRNLLLDPNKINTRFSSDKHRRASLQLKRDKSSSDSGSKIPRLRSSFEAKRTSFLSEMTPEPKRKVSKSRGSDSSSIGSSKIPTRKPDTSFDISSLQISLNDSCFKTPDNNFQTSSSINWVSGSKYLGINSPQEDTSNRRESIALILKNNPGHVQAKVSMYDTRVRETVVCTRSVPSFSTPFDYFDNGKESKSAKKNHKKLHDSRSYDSAENFNRKKNKMRSPLPPPPKFNITDTSTPSAPFPHHIANESQNSLKEISFRGDNYFLETPSGNISHSVKEATIPNPVLYESENSFNLSIKDENNFSKRPLENVSHPLKEVTNISFEMKSPLIKDDYILQEKVLSSGKRQNRLKRSSFNAKSPHKRSKRVSRSESSPGRPRPYDKTHSRMKNPPSRSASNI